MQNENESSGDRRPQDTAFKQQRLPAWQPILTPNYVICSFTTIAIVFIAIGIALLIASNNVFERTAEYHAQSDCAINADTDYGKVCNVEISIDQEVDLPVFVYYQLGNFFQNHRRYVKSRSDAQLRGERTDSGCDPLMEFEGRTLYPCGLIAHSFFSDQIIGAIRREGVSQSLIPTISTEQFEQCNTGDCSLSLTDYSDTHESWRKRGIAWQSDVDAKFSLLEGIGSIDNLPAEFTRVGPEQRRINNALNLTESDPLFMRIPSPLDEDLIVWMRTAGLPNFKKLYRRINSLEGVSNITGSTDKLLPGDTLRFKVRNFFRVADFDGSKAIVISTVSFVGGKNNFLGIAYLVVGSVILFLALAFLVKHIVSPRKLGDMRYFNWNANEGRQRSTN